MSLLLKDRVYTMESPTAKRGVYPLHGYKLGLYRLPIKLEDPLEMKSVFDGLKKTLSMDIYADRIFATYNWIEENMPDPDARDTKKQTSQLQAETLFMRGPGQLAQAAGTPVRLAWKPESLHLFESASGVRLRQEHQPARLAAVAD